MTPQQMIDLVQLVVYELGGTEKVQPVPSQWMCVCGCIAEPDTGRLCEWVLDMREIAAIKDSPAALVELIHHRRQNARRHA